MTSDWKTIKYINQIASKKTISQCISITILFIYRHSQDNINSENCILCRKRWDIQVAKAYSYINLFMILQHEARLGDDGEYCWKLFLEMKGEWMIFFFFLLQIIMMIVKEWSNDDLVSLKGNLQNCMLVKSPFDPTEISCTHVLLLL